MPNKSTVRRRRKFRRYLKGKLDETLPLGALAASALFTQAVGATVNERTFVSSMVADWSTSEHTPDQGSMRVGVAHGDYTTAEILAWIENTGSWNEGDKINQEIAKRLIREIGVFSGALAQETLNDGKKIQTKLGWILLQGQTLRLWVLNEDDTILTTGTDVIVGGHVNLWPQ